jgi:hypothetical protein
MTQINWDAEAFDPILSAGMQSLEPIAEATARHMCQLFAKQLRLAPETVELLLKKLYESNLVTTDAIVSILGTPKMTASYLGMMRLLSNIMRTEQLLRENIPFHDPIRTLAIAITLTRIPEEELPLYR